MSDKALLDQVEAQLVMLRAILQTLIIKVVAAVPPQADERLDDLKKTALQVLSNIPTDPQNLESTREAKKRTIGETEKFFEDIEHALARLRRSLDPRGGH
jgi:hypothetical protein